MKKTLVFLFTAVAVMASAAVAMAAPDTAVTSSALDAIGKLALGAGIGTGLASFGPGIGQGLAVMGAVQGMARNPEATNTLRTNMIIGLAIMESLTIYGLVVALILLYAFPFPLADLVAVL